MYNNSFAAFLHPFDNYRLEILLRFYLLRRTAYLQFLLSSLPTIPDYLFYQLILSALPLLSHIPIQVVFLLGLV